MLIDEDATHTGANTAKQAATAEAMVGVPTEKPGASRGLLLMQKLLEGLKDLVDDSAEDGDD